MLETVSEIFREAYNRNWITARDGNASVRYQRDNHFYITPTGIRKQTLQPEMFLQIDEHGDYKSISPIGHGLKPSGELPFHLYLQRKITTEARIVLHLHPTYTVAAMMAGINLADLVAEFPELGRYSRVGNNVPFHMPVTQALADACVEKLGLKEDGSTEFDIVGMDRHGVVAVDKSPWRAMEHIERIEHISKIVLASGKYK